MPSPERPKRSIEDTDIEVDLDLGLDSKVTGIRFSKHLRTGIKATSPRRNIDDYEDQNSDSLENDINSKKNDQKNNKDEGASSFSSKGFNDVVNDPDLVSLRSDDGLDNVEDRYLNDGDVGVNDNDNDSMSNGFNYDDKISSITSNKKDNYDNKSDVNNDEFDVFSNNDEQDPSNKDSRKYSQISSDSLISLNNKLYARTLVSTKEAGMVIGKSGTNIHNIREESGARVTISGNVPNTHDRVMTIIGSHENVIKAISLISNSLIHEVNEEKSSMLDGNDETLNKVEKDVQVEKKVVNIDNKDVENEGNEENESKQETESIDNYSIKDESEIADDKVDDKEKSNEIKTDNQNPESKATLRILITNSKMGYIIGKGGSSIKMIQEKSGAKIIAHTEILAGSNERVVTLIGTPEQLFVATDEIFNILSSKSSGDRNNRDNLFQPCNGLNYTTILSGNASNSINNSSGNNNNGNRRDNYRQLKGRRITGFKNQNYGGYNNTNNSNYNGNNNYNGSNGYNNNNNGYSEQKSKYYNGEQSQDFSNGRIDRRNNGNHSNTVNNDRRSNFNYNRQNQNHQNNFNNQQPHMNHHGSYQSNNQFSMQAPQYGGYNSPMMQNTHIQPVSQQIYIPKDIVGAIIGKNGNNINRIRKSSGCQIKIEETNGNGENRLVSVTGTFEGTNVAVYMLYENIEREKKRIESMNINSNNSENNN